MPELESIADDNELDLSGVRVQPEDIEQVVESSLQVAACVVAAIDPRPLDVLVDVMDPSTLALVFRAAANDPDPAACLAGALRTQQGDGQRLVAFVEPQPNCSTVDLAELRQLASERLPPALRPSHYSLHDALPRTESGKPDRRAVLGLSPVPTGARIPSRSHVGDGRGSQVRLVAGHFADVLGLDDVAPDDSFFDLGGHSLLALELLLRIEQDMGVEVTVSSLLDRPTPRALAELIHRLSPEDVQNHCLVPIQPNGDRPPIFAIHALGRNAKFYRPLSERLGNDQPVYGLALPVPLPDPSSPSPVIKLASQYCDELERVAPAGPVILTGFSLGAPLAYEVAQQLHARGRTVAALAMFDAVGPGSEATPTRGERARSHRRELLDDPRRFVRRRRKRLKNRLLRRAQLIALRAQNILGLELSDVLWQRAVLEANLAAQGAYDFQPYPGRIFVYKARQSPFTEYLVDVGMGWEGLATGGVRVTVAEGGHRSMFAAPNVDGLAYQLRTDIDAALRASG